MLCWYTPGGGIFNKAYALDVTNYDELKQAITNNPDNETIYLKNDIDFNDYIQINSYDSNSLTIDGGGFAATASNNIGFHINSNNNLNISNFGYTDMETLQITGFSGFSNWLGGVIYTEDNTNVNITNSSFYSNKSSLFGGVISNSGKMNILDSYFALNESTLGGAIFNYNEIENINAVFGLNTAQAGGAIYNAGIINTINSYFEQNETSQYGGAILNAGVVPNILESGYTLTDAKIYNLQGTFKNNKATRGGAIYNGYLNSSYIENINADFEKNSADIYGGAIVNDEYGTIESIENSSFTENTASGGGAIANAGIINTISDTDFTKNTSGSLGGAIGNIQEIGTITNSSFTQNTSNSGGGAIANAGTIKSISADFDGNTAAGNEYDNEEVTSLVGIELPDGGAILNVGEISSLSGTFTNNKAINGQGGAIANINGTINIISTDKATVFTNNTDVNGSNAIANSGTINLNAGKANIVFNDAITGYKNNKGTININKTQDTLKSSTADAGTIEINNTISANTINLYNGTMAFGINGNVDSTSDLNFYDGSINLQNGIIQNTNLGNLTLNSDMDLMLDGDFSAKELDTITVDSFTSNGNYINISNINLIQPTTDESFSLTPIGNISDSSVKQSLASSIQYTGGNIIYSPIYKYNAEYDVDNAVINFTRFDIPQENNINSNNQPVYNDFNPAVMAGAVAAQMGGYLTQLNSYDEAFRNMDMYMLLTKKQRQALKFANKYAAADSNLVFNNLQTPYTDKAGWFRPYATFESVGLKNGPKVNNVAYGSYAGLESEMFELGNGWDGIISLYAGYNGSHQTYQGNSIYQNGGTLGLVGMAYKDNFFTGLTVNAGANVGEANTMYGNEDFTMFMTGIASKSGYNFEMADGKFIIQPNYLMAYSMINTFDYTNAAGVRINSDPLHAITLAPGVKLIGNLNNGWQPYAGVNVVWNIMDKTHFKANDVSLPELSVKPFVMYGVGVRKTWGDRFTGFLQAFLMNGGRNGVGLQTGFRWTLGKDPKKYSNSNVNKKTLKAKV